MAELTEKKADGPTQDQDFMGRPGDVTENPAFRAWFQGSKVVDDHGRPLRVYHGTRGDFHAFDPEADPISAESDRGYFFFTDNTEDASGYASTDGFHENMPGANVMPVYLALKNPETINVGENSGYSSSAAYWYQHGDEVGGDAKANGRDGVILHGHDGTTYVAFSPNQIKSAIGNSGTFDAKDNRITATTSTISYILSPNGNVSAPGHGTHPGLIAQLGYKSGDEARAAGCVRAIVQDDEDETYLLLQMDDLKSAGELAIDFIYEIKPGDVTIDIMSNEGSKCVYKQNIQPGRAIEFIKDSCMGAIKEASMKKAMTIGPVYHGTTYDFDDFKRNKGLRSGFLGMVLEVDTFAFFFTKSKQQAIAYAKNRQLHTKQPTRLITASLTINHLLDLTNPNWVNTPITTPPLPLHKIQESDTAEDSPWLYEEHAEDLNNSTGLLDYLVNYLLVDEMTDAEWEELAIDDGRDGTGEKRREPQLEEGFRAYDLFDNKRVTDALRYLGFDGAKVPEGDDSDFGGESYCVLSANQVKVLSNVDLERKVAGKTAAYTAYVLTNEARQLVLKSFPPKFPDVIAHHVTVDYPAKKDTPLPAPATIRVEGYSSDESLEALVVSVDGQTTRPDGEIYHITLSLDKSRGRKPVDSKSVIKVNGWTPVETPFDIQVIPQKIAKTAMKPKVIRPDITLYRGEGPGATRNGRFWSPDMEFAKQFTQSGLESELLVARIPASEIYKATNLPYGGDFDVVDAVAEIAKAKGYTAVWCNEGGSEPNSVYVFNPSKLHWLRRRKYAAPTGFDINDVKIQRGGRDYSNTWFATWKGKRIGWATLGQFGEDELAKDERCIWKSNVLEEYRRAGVATKLYDAVEEYCKTQGWKLVASPPRVLSEDAFGFWKKRNPETLKADSRTWNAPYIGKELQYKGNTVRLTSLSDKGGVAEFLVPQKSTTSWGQEVEHTTTWVPASVVFEQLGSPKIAAFVDDVPSKLYHTSPSSRRKGIQTRGLLVRQPRGGGRNNEPGVYGLANPDEFYDTAIPFDFKSFDPMNPDATQQGIWGTNAYQDIWEFDTTGLYIRSDEANGMKGSFYSMDNVPPDKLRLYREGKTVAKTAAEVAVQEPEIAMPEDDYALERQQYGLPKDWKPQGAPQVKRDEPATETQVPKSTPPTEPVAPPKTPAKPRAKKPKPFIYVPPEENKKFKTWFGRSKVVDYDDEPLVVYHGTTHEFDVFEDKKGNPEGHYGKGHYFTSSREDTENYAGMGPDLTNRIEREAENLSYKWDSYEDVDSDIEINIPGWDDMDDEEKAETWDGLTDDDKMDIAKAHAKKRIAGEHGGAVMPCYLRINKPVIVAAHGGTYFNIGHNRDGDPSGKLFDAVERTMMYTSVDPYKFWWDVVAEDYPDGLTAFEFEKKVRNSETMMDEDIMNEGGPGPVIAAIYREMGFDGIIMENPADEFSNMRMEDDTRHFIVWNANQIKSALGNSGKFDKKNPSVTAAKTAGLKDPLVGNAPKTATAGNPVHIGVKTSAFDGTGEFAFYVEVPPEFRDQFLKTEVK